jgi:hypothetical protein
VSQAPLHDPSLTDEASASAPPSLEPPDELPPEELPPEELPPDELPPEDEPPDEEPPLEEPPVASVPESSPGVAGPPLLLLHPAAKKRPIVASVRFMVKLPYLGFEWRLPVGECPRPGASPSAEGAYGRQGDRFPGSTSFRKKTVEI